MAAKKTTRSRKRTQKKKGLRFMGITARLAMTICAGLMLISCLSVFVNPAKVWIATVFGILFLPFLLLNLFLLVWAIMRRSKSFWIPLVALAPALVFLGAHIQFGKSVEPYDGEKITAVSYNVGRFAQYSAEGGVSSRKECLQAVADFLKECDADIICLQEFYLQNGQSVKNTLSKYFPGYNSAYFVYNTGRGQCGNVTLSRYPIVDKGSFNFEESSNLAVCTDLRIGADKIRVYNCHFESYNISIPRLIKAIGHDDQVVQETEDKVRRSITKRPKQVDVILRDIASCEIETMVAGDFNDTPMSYTYTKLKKHTKDSFVEAGKGFGGTYSILYPFLRIDYILFPERYTADRHEVRKVHWSDHYPVITEFYQK